jgi:thiol-disulfide isomerase/thioredoxin
MIVLVEKIMIRLTIVLILFICSESVEAQIIDRFFIENDGDTILLGRVSPERLKRAPFSKWFHDSYDAYQMDTSLVDQLETSKNEIDSITIFMGTWCGDSRREVPRFIKTIESIGFDFEKLSVICVDHGRSTYKQSPEGEERGLNIHRVPTFIFHDEAGLEINRIIESPVESIEKDITNIIEGNYQPNYKGVTYLAGFFNRQDGLAYVRDNYSLILDEVSQRVMNPYELNTYGRMLLTSFQLAEAELVYELNADLYPDFFVGHYYLATMKMRLGKYKEARQILEVADAPDQYEKQKLELMSMIAQKSTR